MIQGTILKKKKPLCLNVVFSTCDFIPITGSTAHQITITAISHIHLISDFFSTPVTFSFFPSLWALICAPPVYLICLQAHSKEENISRFPHFFYFLFKECFLFSECMSHRSWPNPLSPRISLSGGIERTSQCHRRPLQSCGDIKCHCMLWSHWCKLFLPHGS